VSVSRLRRFLHIERSRGEDPEPSADPTPDTAQRFGNVERPGRGELAGGESGAHLGRFAPAPEPGIELLETDAGERPFTRCMRCGMDHHVFATECTGCGASLDTAPQREFNERLWAERQAEAGIDARAAAERQARQAREAVELAQARRAMGEALAREVGERERRRLGLEGWGRGGPGVVLDLLGWLWRIVRRG
jgi:hypothetical protein